METPVSQCSLPKRCYPDDCDLALGGPAQDVSGFLFKITDSKRFIHEGGRTGRAGQGYLGMEAEPRKAVSGCV